MRLELLNKRLLIAGFFLFIFSVGIYFVLSKEHEASKVEYRNLAQQPDMTLESLVEGSYVKKFESYFTDQFPGRNVWIRASVHLQRLTGKTFLNGYYVSPEGWIIAETKLKYSKEAVQKTSKDLNEFAEYASKRGTEVIYTSLPHKVNTVKVELPSYINEGVSQAKKDYFLSLLSRKHLQVLDIGKIFKTKYTQKQINEMYFKTDHHWNAQGSFAAYQEIRTFLGQNSKYFVDVAPEYKTTYYDKKFLGSWNRLIYELVDLRTDKVSHILPKNNPFKNFKVTANGEESSFEEIYGSEVKKKGKLAYGELFTQDYKDIKIYNPDLKKGRLLIVKDSYANPIIFHMAQHYQQTVVVDVRHSKESLKEYIEKEQQFDTILFLYNDLNADGPLFQLN